MKLISTDRLFLREMTPDDYQALFQVLGDPETMWHYPYTFDGQHVRDWIERNMNRYRKDGFGLWAVCLRESGEMIGDCGLTLQNINGELLPEIGYHIRRDCQRKGYAKEAAKAVRDWAFRNTDYPALYSYCKYTNIPSFRTAESIGMRFACEYPDQANGTTHVSVISREDWLHELTENLSCERLYVKKRRANMVREARKEDLDALLKLYLFLHEESIPELNAHLEKTWNQIIEDPNHHLIVNEIDGQIISSCVCVIIPNLTRNVRPYAFVENVVTHADYRRKGYAGECLEFARRIAEQENCYKMMLLTGSKKPETLHFYEKAGYNSNDKTAFVQWIRRNKQYE